GNDVFIGGSGADSIRGSFGADTLTGGAGADTFLYRNAAESSGTHHDTIVGFDYSQDKIDLPVSVSGFSATPSVTQGSLSTASFDADLAAAVNGALDPNKALLFTASAGDYAGKTFLVVDGNGDGSYQVDQDYVFLMQAPTQPISTADTGFLV
ncbi:MAG TPA: M10 family metallopeptidase C-terminal domain-containing protein, partial [Geminicoccaceae bacterium]